MPFNGANVVAVPGTLYAAPLGTAEPVACTGAWPSGWLPLGYTEQGNQYQMKLTTAAITPEEQYTPIRNVTTALDHDITFNLWELTARNWNLALNNGLAAPTQAPGTTDGSYLASPAVVGTEVRVMIGWDSLTNATTSGTVAGRMIMRQAFQTGNVALSRRKGANVASLALTFSAEQPNPNVIAVYQLIPAGMVS